MGNRIAAFAWSKHPLGPPESWPQSLKTAVSLILNSQHPMWIGWGPQMSFLYNDAYLHVLGLAKHPWALGRPASEVWSEIWDVCGPLADKVFRYGQASFADDVRLFMTRGDFLEETYYSFSYSPIRDESGDVGGLFCPSNDVTAKVIGARRLRTLSELAANALAQKSAATACASAAATLAKNPDDVPFALLYLVDENGYVLKESIGPSPSEHSFDAEIASVIASGRPQQITLRGTAIPHGAANVPVREGLILPVAARAQTRPLGALVVGLNPTRRLDADYDTFFDLVASNIGTAIQNARAAEDETKRADMLAEMDRAKTIFFSNVSHEFRTPLTLLLAPVEDVIAKQPQGGYEETRSLLRLAYRNGLRLRKLVNTLLDFSRIEAGRAQALYLPTNVSALTADLASNFRSAYEAAGIQLVVDCPDLSDNVYVDRGMWEKIVLNLLSNAFKFTFDGSIVVRLREQGNDVELTVEDTGVGIPASELPHLFERFHRVQGQQSRTHEGSGIGLALVSELVRLHGGSVSAQSELKKGTTIFVRIPRGHEHLDASLIGEENQGGASSTVAEYLAEVETTIGNASPTDAETSGVGRARVLLADDNHDLREYATRVLAPWHDVVAVRNGAQALERLRNERFDLVITDVMMPEMDGFQLLDAIRSDERIRTTTVMMLSARAGEESAVEGLSRGADDYLAKPFSASELLARTNAHVGAARARAARLQEELRSNDWFSRPGEETISAASFRAIADQLPFIVWLQDTDGSLSFVNEAWYSATRLPRTEQSLRPEAWIDCVHPEDLPRVQESMEKAVAAREPYEFEFRLKPHDGDESTYRWFIDRGRPQYRDGVFQGWLGTAEDIHAQREVLSRTQRIAQTLQESLLPGRLPRTDRFRVDAVYQAAEADALVGGDWFDAVQLPDGRTLLSVGDVAGHGTTASTIAGRLRHAIRDFAIDGDDPAVILHSVNRILRHELTDIYATALVAFVDANVSSLTYANAGHPPPLLADKPSMPAIELSTGGLLLGVNDDLHLSVSQVSLAADSIIALYTDGLIEFERDLSGAQARLREAVGNLVHNTAPRPAVVVRNAVLAGAATVDDAALLIVQFSPPLGHQPQRIWRCDARDPYATRACRAQVMEFIRSVTTDAASLFEAELVLGELLANTVEHAPGEVEVQLDWRGEKPIVVVRDSGPGLRVQPRPLPKDAFAEHGRGLYLVNALAEDVVVSPLERGTEIRATLPTRRKEA
jgi:PAS domain S-box-containing protein